MSRPAQKARHQYLIRVQGSLQLPSSTSWSGQLHHGAGKETAGWKRPEQSLLTGFNSLAISREPAGSSLRCAVSLRWHCKGTTGTHLKISQTQNIQMLPIKQLRDVSVRFYRRHCLFVKSCGVLNVLSPMWDNMRQPSICQKNLLPPFFFILPTERMHSDPSHPLRDPCLEAAARWRRLPLSCS